MFFLRGQTRLKTPGAISTNEKERVSFPTTLLLHLLLLNHKELCIHNVIGSRARGGAPLAPKELICGITNECGWSGRVWGSVRWARLSVHSDEDGEHEIASNPINIFIKSFWFYALLTRTEPESGGGIQYGLKLIKNLDSPFLYLTS